MDRPTREIIAQYLDYDPATGVLRWRVKRRRVNSGDIAGAHRPNSARSLLPASDFVRAALDGVASDLGLDDWGVASRYRFDHRNSR